MKLSNANREANSLANIRIQLVKSFAVLAALGLLFYLQFEFIHRALFAQPVLNLAIILVFSFGTAMAISANLHLFGEYRALQAMKETWTDFDEMDRTNDHAGVLRLMRTAEPAHVFSKPRILGPVYDVVMGELLKTRALNTSLAQRNSLVATINDGINREKSLVTYITGTMILMGLIGTFIGLMEMVASVGGIVGGLAKVGAGSDEAIKNVIRDLEAPLTGMATGFSASLFGLFGSLSLGLIARFVNSATLGVRHEFETWISKISSVEVHGSQLSGASGAGDSTTLALAGSLLGAFRTTQGLINRSAEVMRRLGERQETQTDVLAKLVEQVETLSVRQSHTLAQLKRVDMIGDALDNMREEAILRDRAASNRLADGIGRIAQVVDESRSHLFSAVQDVAEQHRASERLARALELQQNRGFEALALELSTISAAGEERGRVSAEHYSEVEKLIRTSLRPLDVRTIADQLGASVDERLAAGFGAVAASFDDSLDRLLGGLDRLGQTQAELADRLLAMDSGTSSAEEMRAFGKNIEQGIANGLNEIARVLDGVLLDKVRQLKDDAVSAQKDPASDPALADEFKIDRAVTDAIIDRFRKKSQGNRIVS